MKTILIITVIESAIAALVLFLWYFKTASEKMLRTPALTTARANEHAVQPVVARRNLGDESRWAFINSWQVKPQADDRELVGSVRDSSGDSPSGQRSTRRRRQQVMFKEWSKARHD